MLALLIALVAQPAWGQKGQPPLVRAAERLARQGFFAAAGDGPNYTAGKRHASAQDDRTIRRDVQAALVEMADVDHTNIRVFVSKGIVTLRGTVSTSYQKALVERAAEQVSGTRLVINQIKIVGPRTDNTHSKPGKATLRPSLAAG